MGSAHRALRNGGWIIPKLYGRGSREEGMGRPRVFDGWEGMCGRLGVNGWESGRNRKPEIVIANLNSRRRELISFDCFFLAAGLTGTIS